MIDNAKKIALTSYSMWANYLGLIVLIAPEVTYWQWGIDTNPRVWWSMGVALILAGTIGRFMSQPGSSWAWRTVKAVIIAAVLVVWGASAFAMTQRPSPAPEPVVTAPTVETGLTSNAEFLKYAVPLTGKWEGLRTTAYLDTIASPPVWTVCYGETKGVKAGDRYTKAECDAMLARELIDYRERLRPAFTMNTINYRLPVKRDVAYTDLAYNAGVGAISKSTAVRRLNAGDIAGGCEAIGWWNKAGGRVIRGLVNRRVEDIAYCMDGL